MRILHIGKYYPPVRGGMESFVADLAAAQVRAGHAVHVVCHRDFGLRSECAEAAGVTVLRAGCLGRLAFAPVSPGLPGLLLRQARDFRPDVLHLHLPNPSAVLEGLFPGHVPRIVHWHADVAGAASPALRLLYPVYRCLERRLLRRARLVVATSPAYAASSAALAEVADKVRVVPLGLDPGRLGAGGEAADGDGPAFDVLAVGRLSYYKGFEHLIRAAALLPGRTVGIVGAGPLRDALARRIGELGLRDRVRLLGEVSDAALAGLYARCRVFCLSSVERSEAFGVVLLEAMLHARPLVTTAIPGSGVGFVNVAGETGLVAERSSAESLAGALRRLLDDPGLARRLGEAGQARF
ncbi:MAG: glycosyltransferase, partial [Desulfovibrionaceae bacterium]